MPLQHKNYQSNALSEILKLVPEGSIVDSYMFFTGELEIALAKYRRFVCAHTTQYVVYEFWKCMAKDSAQIYNIVTSEHFKFDKQDFEYLQKKWAHFKDQYIRSALFFLLNKCSTNGSVSYGNMERNLLDRSDLATLRTFKMPKNIHLVYDKMDFIDSLKETVTAKANYTIINAGLFPLNLIGDNVIFGLEETSFEHTKLCQHFMNTHKKTIIVYKYNKRVVENYSSHAKTLIFLNDYGNVTDEKGAKEVLIANF